MMLGSEDDTLHSRRLYRPCPLLTVEAGGIETLQWSVAIAPFAVSEGVRTEVDEGVGLQLVPCHLCL